MKTVGIKELKNNLSAYLREVRRGTRILVSDRSRVVAELHEPGALYATDPGHPLMAEWIANKSVRPISHERKPLADSPVSLPEGSSSDLLDADRGDRA